MLGIGELLVVVSVGVLILGWRRIPQVGSSLRKTLLGFKSGVSGEEEANPSREVKEYSSDEKIPPTKKS